jgi:hypothetical protein
MPSFLRRSPGLVGAAAIVAAVLIALFALALVAGGELPWLQPEPTPGTESGLVPPPLELDQRG